LYEKAETTASFPLNIITMALINTNTWHILLPKRWFTLLILIQSFLGFS